MIIKRSINSSFFVRFDVNCGAIATPLTGRRCVLDFRVDYGYAHSAILFCFDDADGSRRSAILACFGS